MPWRTLSDAVTAAQGGPLRSLFDALRAAVGLAPSGSARAKLACARFTAAVVCLSAKLSASDGVALRIEEQAFEQVFHTPPDQHENVRRLFAQAKTDSAGFEAYAAEVAAALDDDPDVKHEVFDALLHIASADGVLHPAEDSYLAAVAERFGYTATDYRAHRARFVHDADDPYVILGVPHEISNEDLKAHYRRLVRENHPDALVAHGAPQEFCDMAERRLAGINAAWDEVSRERGL